MSSARTLLLLAVALAAVAVPLLLSRPDRTAPPAPSDAPSPQVDAARFDDWVPVLREGAEVTFSEREVSARDPQPGPATPVGQQQTLGPLDDPTRQRYVQVLERLAASRFAQLHALGPVAKPGACHDLVVQAALLADAEEAAAAADALAQGSYFTTAPGALPPGPPEAGIVQFNAVRDGQPVNVSVILPWKKYPRFAEAWQYKLEVAANYPEYVVGEFNEKDAAWRRAAVDRYRANEVLAQKPADYREFRARWFPRGVRVDADNALLVYEGR